VTLTSWFLWHTTCVVLNCNYLWLAALTSKLPPLHDPPSLSRGIHWSLQFGDIQLPTHIWGWHPHRTTSVALPVRMLPCWPSRTMLWKRTLWPFCLIIIKLPVQDKSSAHQDSRELSRIIWPMISIPWVTKNVSLKIKFYSILDRSALTHFILTRNKKYFAKNKILRRTRSKYVDTFYFNAYI